MLDLKFIRENKKLVEASIRNRGIKLDLDEFLRLDEEHRRLLIEVEGLKA
ncbi:MAG: serine--tRNA ligase, partial [Candidatus Omnitrophica bacterium]|nr:serine--tRNA ligase [Candidatus Omnitrophota bacterium]